MAIDRPAGTTRVPARWGRATFDEPTGRMVRKYGRSVGQPGLGAFNVISSSRLGAPSGPRVRRRNDRFSVRTIRHAVSDAFYRWARHLPNCATSLSYVNYAPNVGWSVRSESFVSGPELAVFRNKRLQYQTAPVDSKLGLATIETE